MQWVIVSITGRAGRMTGRFRFQKSEVGSQKPEVGSRKVIIIDQEYYGQEEISFKQYGDYRRGGDRKQSC